MRHPLVLPLALCAIVLTGSAWIRVQQVKPASISPTTIDEVLVAVRSDLQATRADIVAKNVTLTAAQGAKFWPLFEAYQKEQNAIMDDQLKGIQRYIEGFDSLDDAGATELIKAHLDRDANMVALRRQWLGRFQDVLGPKLAARVIQIDRRLSLTHQIQLTTKIPLIH
jgi:hypothetical protein